MSLFDFEWDVECCIRANKSRLLFSPPIVFFFGGTYTTVGDATENVQRDGISERKQ